MSPALGFAAMRCFGDGDELYERYHDEEWGRPVLDERGLYERICLEAFQSGISWSIVLRKRAAIRQAFRNFDPDRVACFEDRDVARLLDDAAVIRNRAKIRATIANARATLELRGTDSPLPALIWSYRPDLRPAPRDFSEVPPTTTESVQLAKSLRTRGFKFVGPTTVYALMQACGLVNDHLAGCSVREEVEQQQAAVTRPPSGGRIDKEAT